MRGWKIIEERFAPAALHGKFRIGTFQSFHDLENQRGDKYDRAVSYHIDRLLYNNYYEARELNKLGARGNIMMMDCVENIHSPPLWIFCLTVVGNGYNPQKYRPKSILEISDLELFAETVTKSYSEIIENYKLQKVVYDERFFNIKDPFKGMPNPFVKRRQFNIEKEIRIIFFPRDGFEVSPFIIEENSNISALVSGVRARGFVFPRNARHLRSAASESKEQLIERLRSAYRPMPNIVPFRQVD
jgi:hypothetical protein